MVFCVVFIDVESHQYPRKEKDQIAKSLLRSKWISHAM